MKNVKLKAKKRIVESDAAEALDPDIQALFNAVNDLESNKPGSGEKFLKIIQGKYGVKSTKDLSKGMSLWLKVPAAGLSLAGFIGSIGLALNGVANIGRFDPAIASGDFVNGGQLGLGAATLLWGGVVLSFVFFKIFRYILSRSSKTEGIDPATTKEYNDILARKAVLECSMLAQQLSALTESDVSEKDSEETSKKAEGLCHRMFAWIKEKFKAGAQWVKKHPYITVAFLIVIGLTFLYGLNVKAQEAFVAQAQTTMSATEMLNNKICVNAIEKALPGTKRSAQLALDGIIRNSNADLPGFTDSFVSNLEKMKSKMPQTDFLAYLTNLSNEVSRSKVSISTISKSGTLFKPKFDFSGFNPLSTDDSGSIILSAAFSDAVDKVVGKGFLRTLTHTDIYQNIRFK